MELRVSAHEEIGDDAAALAAAGEVGGEKPAGEEGAFLGRGDKSEIPIRQEFDDGVGPEGGRELGQHALADHQATFTRSLAQGRLGAVRPLRIVGDDIEQDGGVNGRDHRARD